MSQEISSDSTAMAPKSRKAITKRLSTGNKITLSPPDDKTLKAQYEYMAGYFKRKKIESAIEAKKKEVDKLHHEIPPAAKILMKQRAAGGGVGAAYMNSSYHNNIDDDVDNERNMNDNNIARKIGKGNSNNNNEMIADAGTVEGDEATVAERIRGEKIVDQYYGAKEQLLKLEERLKIHMQMDHKIALNDIDAVVKSLGMTMNKKQLEQMIWEVDENLDELIDIDEFQLTYYRNIMDSTGNEPNSFFKILEFMIFDGTHKGYIIEDDCMEILYARYGGGNLEKEMKLLFGSRLRAEGGDGTLNLETYLGAMLSRTGRRALVL